MTWLGAFRYRLAALMLASLALWEIGVLLRVERGAPGEQDWRSAAAAVREGHRVGDLVVFAPEWIDPVGRRWLGDLIPIQDAARMDAERYARLWEVSIRGATAPEAEGAEQLSEQRFGAVRVRQLRQTAPRVTWDSRRHGQVHEVDYRPRDCVMLRLRRAEDEARVRYASVPLGSELHVAVGLADSRARRDNRATARLEVKVDDRPATGALLDADSGWRSLPVAPTRPGRHDVELIASVDHWSGPIRLDLCVAFESRSSL